MDKEALKNEAVNWRKFFRNGQKNWSAVHHATIFGSIVCSVIAGAILQVKGQDFSSCAAVLTSIAAALTSLAATGGFERKWKSNRISRSRVDCLLIDIEAESPNITELATQLKDIIAKHDEEIVKSETVTPEQPMLQPDVQSSKPVSQPNGGGTNG